VAHNVRKQFVSQATLFIQLCGFKTRQGWVKWQPETR